MVNNKPNDYNILKGINECASLIIDKLGEKIGVASLFLTKSWRLEQGLDEWLYCRSYSNSGLPDQETVS